MKKGEKKFILWLIVISVIIIVLVMFFTKKDENGKRVISAPGQQKTTQQSQQPLGEFEQRTQEGYKINVSSQLNQEKEYKGFKISNISLTENGGETVLLADVENVSGRNIEDFTTIDIKFVNKDGEEIGTITGLITPLEAEGSTQLNASVTADYTNAFDFEISEHAESQE